MGRPHCLELCMLSLIESEACCEPGGFLWNDTRSVTHWVAKLLPGRLVGLTREGPRLASSSREEDADEPAGLDAKSHVALDQAECRRPRRSPRGSLHLDPMGGS